MTAPDLTIQPDEIHWRVGSTYDKSGTKYGMLLGYIDARDAMTKLDQLDPLWSTHMEAIRVGVDEGVRCTLTVNGISREDVGVPSDTEGLKGAFSDALKRAAVHFGIGRELYDLPTIAVECEMRPNGKVGKPKALPRWNGKQWTIDSNLGWVRYDTPPTQPERGEQVVPAAGRRGVPTSAAPSPAQYRRGELAELLREKDMHIAQLERFADLVGIPKGQRATEEQMDDLIDAVRAYGITQPEPVRAHAGSGVGPATVGRGGDGSSDLPAALDTPHAAGTAAATVSAELGTQPAPAPSEVTRPDAVASGMTNEEFHASLAAGRKRADVLLDEAVAVSGGVDVTPPPKPGTPEYVALPAPAKASARAYWQRQSEPEPVEQLQVPV